MGGSRFNDQEYKNWLRDTLALMYMKEGVEEFVDNQSTIFHTNLRSGLPPCPSYCTADDIRKDLRNQRWYMTCTSCDAWLQKVITLHTSAPFPQLSPENTDPQLWPTVPWETLKLFMPYGCEAVQCAKEADLQGILSLFKNCEHFRQSGHIGRLDLLEELLKIRNDLFHSGSYKVSDSDVNDHLQKVLAFLQGLSGLSGTSIQDAQDKIMELQSNVLDLSLNKELELRALQQTQTALNGKLRTLENTVTSLYTEQGKTKTTLHQTQTTLHQTKTAVDRKLTTLENTARNLQTKQGNHSTTMTSFDTKVNQLQTAIAELKSSKEKFEEFLRQNNLVQDMTNLSTKVKVLYQRIDNIEEQMKSKGNVVGPGGVKSWEEQCTGVQQHLLKIYSNISLWENPMTGDEEHTPEMYVQPAMRIMTEKDGHEGFTEVKEQSSQSCRLTYQNVFQSKGGPCKNIYITGDAGTGKTMFCKRLVFTWCKAVQNLQDPNVSPEDLQVLSSFKFVFHINLRDSEQVYYIDDMIRQQLFYKTSLCSMVSDILNAESCLIVLDGLDEWSCPDDLKIFPLLNSEIPGRNITDEACVFLTTSRSWKYDVIDLKSKDVDKHVKLLGIDKGSSKELAQTMLSYLERKSKKGKKIADFDMEIQRKGFGSLIFVPVLLIQLITLWHYGKDFGNSQLQLYCSMLELLFERSKRHISKNTSAIVAQGKQLPDCLRSKENCNNHAELIQCLTKLSFKSLFNKQKENALVFKSSTLKIYGISDVSLCLQCGILSQNKDYSNYSGRYKKFSFLHKQIQEFLAALYITTVGHVNAVIEEIRQFCDSLNIMLEMSQVWMFLAGMKPDITKQLLTHLTTLVTADKHKQIDNYRQTLFGAGLVRDIQKCVTACITESHNNGYTLETICLEDLYITKTTICNVQNLLSCTERPKIRSVQINTYLEHDDRLTTVTDRLQQCDSIKKLYLRGPISNIPSDTVATIVTNNLKTLTCLALFSNITATDKLVTAFCRVECIITLCLHGVNMAHIHREQILSAVPKFPNIRHLVLLINCTYHGNIACAVLDLSSVARTPVQSVQLWKMYVNNIQFLPRSVENVILNSVLFRDTDLLEFAHSVPQRHGLTVKLKHIYTRDSKQTISSYIEYLIVTEFIGHIKLLAYLPDELKVSSY